MSRTSQVCFLNKYIFLLKGYMIVVVFKFFHNLFYFTGCKIALFCGDKLLTILRDDTLGPICGSCQVEVVKGTKALLSVQRVKFMKNWEFI